MNSAKQTILYSRLSREDERANESLSIENQKAFLEEYANRNGFFNLVHLCDDGWSGTRWDRPGMAKLLDEVEVHEADKSTGKRIQKVDIHLNFIGNFELPLSEQPPQEELPTVLSKGRKPRRLMTPEELEHEREIDRRAYAKKKAARLAKEEAERAKILAGTSFEQLSVKHISKDTQLAV